MAHMHLCLCGHDLTWHRYFAYGSVAGPCRRCRCIEFTRWHLEKKAS